MRIPSEVSACDLPRISTENFPAISQKFTVGRKEELHQKLCLRFLQFFKIPSEIPLRSPSRSCPSVFPWNYLQSASTNLWWFFLRIKRSILRCFFKYSPRYYTKHSSRNFTRDNLKNCLRNCCSGILKQSRISPFQEFSRDFRNWFKKCEESVKGFLETIL